MGEKLMPYGPEHPDYPNEPSDWDGGPYLCRDGQLYHMRGYGWEHGLGCWNATAEWDRIAYRARTPQDTPKQDGGKAPDMGSHESERKRDRRYTRQHGGKDNG